MAKQKGITKRSEDFSQWYLDIVEAADLAENSVVRGCMVIKPNGYALWENFQKVLDGKFKALGHRNAYFPLLIPKSFFTKEAQHAEGFAKESAIVTHYRMKLDENKNIIVDPEAKLEEELIIRPTSETIIYDSFSKWIKSYRDLPLLLNQWANVLRWEMRTRPFLRSAEFLWQEGHTAHATQEESEAHSLKMLEAYRSFAEDFLAIPVIPGQKSESEKFAGAYKTYTIEAMMQDGKAVQAGTSHNMADNFAKVFDIKYQDQNGELVYANTTSWGLSTRMIGALIMVHSDDKGLVVPPKIAPTQVIIIPIWKTEEEKSKIMSVVEQLQSELTDLSIHIETRDYMSVGERFFDAEKQGIPVRIEIGPKDIENNQVVIARRDTGEKASVNLDQVQSTIKSLLDHIQINLYEKAKQFRDERIYIANSYDELKDIVENKQGFALAHWDGTEETEAKVKEETKATIRCIPFNLGKEEGVCIISGKPSKRRVLFGKAY
jgi:prolyl-tRNA synthetase